MEKDTTNRKRKLSLTDKKKTMNPTAVSKRNDQDEIHQPSLLTVTRRPVRRKLCFDNVTDSPASASHHSNGRKTSNDTNRSNVATTAKNVPVRTCPFNVQVENLLNSTLEANRKRCIEKYNFDPVLEKPLEGKYKWEKL